MENKEKTKISVPVTKDMLKSVGVDAIEIDNPIILLNDTPIVAETLYGDSLADIYRQLPYKNGGHIMILKMESSFFDLVHNSTKKLKAEKIVITEKDTDSTYTYIPDSGTWFELDMKTGYHEDNVDIRYVLRWFPFDINRK